MDVQANFVVHYLFTMRLGQFARKYDVPVQDIITYLEEETGEKFHANAKIYDTLEAKVFDHFELIPAIEEDIDDQSQDEVATLETAADEETEPEVLSDIETKEEAEEWPATPEDEIAALDGDLATAVVKEEVVDQIVENATAEEDDNAKHEPAPDEVIQTDKLLEMLESDEAPADLDRIKLIKAPKKELSGLKVVGKVDLPEPKKKEEKEKENEIVTEKDLREYRNPGRKKRQPLTEAEKEKRRLKAKKKKEAYEARQAERRKEQEDRKKKARKEAHYKQKLEQAKAVQTKQKANQPSIAPKQKEDSRPEPKTVLGRFWRWMNT